MIVRELFAKLGFKVDPAGLEKFESGLGQAKEGMKGLLAVIAAGGASVIGLAHHTAEAAFELEHMAVRAGVGVEEFQKLAFAAGSTGVSTEELAISMTFLNRHLYEARNGSKEAAKAFALLGPGVANAVKSGKSADEVFSSIADAIANIKDPAKRAHEAVAIFGRSGARLLPILSQGSDAIATIGDKAEALGLVFDHDAIESSERFIKSFRMLGKVAKGTANIVGIGLVKAIQPFLDAIVEVRVESAKASAGKIKDAFLFIFKVSKATAAFVFNLARAVNTLLGPLGGVLGVLKAVVAGFVAFKALQLIVGIGKMTQGIYAMAAAWQFGGTAAGIAQLKMIAVPLLIGLAIIGLLLLLEDLYVFMTGGGDSIIGLFAEKFPEAFKVVKSLVGPTFMPLIKFFQALTDGTWSWLDALKTVGETIVNLVLMPFRLVMQTLGAISSIIGSIAPSSGLSGVGDFLRNNAGVLTAQGIGQSLASAGPSGGLNQNNQVAQNITVNVGDGVDPNLIATKVGDASSGGLNDVFRSAGRTLAPGVAY